MRKWGIVISTFYALILLVLIVPTAAFFSGAYSPPSDFFRGLGETYSAWLLWVPAGSLLVGQVVLLFASVDTSQKRLRPRAHIFVSCITGALLTALLTSGVFWSLGVAIQGDKFGGSFYDDTRNIVGSWAVLWLVWVLVFYLYLRNSSAVVTRVVSWLLKGSVLELLIAVPCHVIVRRRHDCSAPIVTSFGIATGIAIMLLSFGPSVFFLYKKRLDAYPPRSSD